MFLCLFPFCKGIWVFLPQNYFETHLQYCMSIQIIPLYLCVVFHSMGLWVYGFTKFGKILAIVSLDIFYMFLVLSLLIQRPQFYIYCATSNCLTTLFSIYKISLIFSFSIDSIFVSSSSLSFYSAMSALPLITPVYFTCESYFYVQKFSLLSLSLIHLSF